MRPPILPSPKMIHTSDLQPLYEFVNSLQFDGDQINITVDHNVTGVSINLVGDTGGGTSGGGASTTVAGYKIASGGNGVYTANKIDQTTGEPSQEDYTVIATRATAYNLPATTYVVGFDITVTTLGG